MYRFILLLLLFTFSLNIKADSINSIDVNFQKAFTEIENMLNDKQKPSFKRAVFVVENAYFNDSLNYSFYLSLIDLYKKTAIAYKETNPLKSYTQQDSTDVNLNGALFKIFTDTIFDIDNQIVSTPFEYNFEDALGNEDFTNTFITKMLITKKGTCHSLPYLYKIISEELGTKAYLAFAPHHIYLKQRNKKVGWYNTELTSGQFPNDGYLMATGYISRDNIMSGIYMDTLSYKQSIATCLMDLSYSYRAKRDTLAKNDFVLKCADAALKVYPNYVQALLVKAETHKSIYIQAKKENNTSIAESNFKQMKDTYNQLIKYDYREVPAEVFNKWYSNYRKNKDQYQNSEINSIFNSPNKKQ